MGSPADVLEVLCLGSPVDLELIRFPDGQVNAVVDFPKGEDAVIKRSINSFNALQEVLAVKSALEMAATNITLYAPYILGGRSDRRFQDNGTDYLSGVIAPILNECDFDGIVTLDPHSQAMGQSINGLREKSLRGFHRWIDGQIGHAAVVSPDKGAEARASLYHETAGSENCTFIQCQKVRDIATGKIMESSLPAGLDFSGEDVVIVDDICDGGATFLSLGKKIRDANCGKLYLAVTHGIFSKGFSELRKVFDLILCTDSFVTVSGVDFVRQYKL